MESNKLREGTKEAKSKKKDNIMMTYFVIYQLIQIYTLMQNKFNIDYDKYEKKFKKY